MIHHKVWNTLTEEEKKYLFKQANLLDRNGELLQPITQEVIKMLINVYYNKSNIITK